jgi:hypothetical protein
MKRMLMLLALMALCFPMSIYAQGEEEPQSVYIEGTRSLASTHSDVWSYWCDQNASRSLTFDLESISGGDMLDLAIGQTIRLTLGWPGYYGFQNYNSGTGTFPDQDGDFFYNYVNCSDNDRIYNFVFGKLRPAEPRKDLAVLRQTGIYIYINTGNGMGSLAQPAFGTAAIDATWGAFTSGDNSQDLAVSDGSEVRIYPNLNTGEVDETPVTFSIPARRVVLAQMDEDIYSTNQTTKWDLVSISGNGAQTDNLLSIRLNDGNNGLGTPQEIDMGDNYIYSVVVGDINNDNFNDVIVAMSGDVRLYLNDGAGEIRTTPTWSITSGVPSNPQVLIGDLGNTSDGTSNDGWNDLLLTGYQAPVKIFINQGSGDYFNSSPEESFDTGSPYTQVGKVMLADVQNTGGLSFIYALYESSGRIYVNKHVGDPAPAPPKNVAAGYTSCPSVQHPVISWAQNSERDLLGYNIYKSSDGGQQWVKQNSSLITGNSWTDYTEGIDCEIHEGWPVWRHYRVTGVDNASNESSPSAQVAALVDGPAPNEKRAGDATGRPESYALHTAYPNPFNPSTQIKFDLPEGGVVSLAVYDVLGRKVADLVNEYREAGYYSTTWNAANVSSGVYFGRFTVTNEFGRMQYTKMSKLVLMK